jgi:predicted nuclease of predicted toxin-antitoxin system
MKIKLDENIPVQLAGILATLGHEADTVADEKLKGQPDPTIWQVAQDSKECG